jgi:hypothetical protein
MSLLDRQWTRSTRLRQGFGVASKSGVERFADFGRELFGIEWLRQEKHSRRGTFGRGQRFFEITGNE